MADSQNKSIEEILAACRGADGAGGGASGEAASSADSGGGGEQPASGGSPAATASAASSGGPGSGGKKPGEMSVAEMLAAARAEKQGGASSESASGGGAPSTPAAGGGAAKPAEMSVADMLAAARAEKKGGSAAGAGESGSAAGGSGQAAAKKSGEMSVADMLAAARAEKSKPAASAASAAPAAKPAPGKPAAAPKAQAAAEPATGGNGGVKDTASILAAARKSSKPGPVSKAEAAAAGVAAKAAPAGKAKLAVPPMPAKPDYARPVPAQAVSAGADRRGFFTSFAAVFLGSSLAVGFTSLTVTSLLWVLGFARFMFPNVLIEPPTRFKVGFPDDYGPGQVETKFKAQFGVWIVRYEYEGAPQIYALSTVCTHLGCTPNWLDGEQKFKCPCHGSGFYKSGINFEGPAPRPLERYAIRVADDGQLEVDKSRKFQEELGQWKDSSCYVSV